MRLKTEGIIIAGSYEINGHNTLIEAGLKSGDIINQINDKNVNNALEIAKIIDTCNCNSLKINYIFQNYKLIFRKKLLKV
jgi:hypothetical protein